MLKRITKGEPGYREKDIHEFSVKITKREGYEAEEPTFSTEILGTSEHAAWSQAIMEFYTAYPDESLDDYDIVVTQDYQEV
jgi:hypothetical protein